LVGYLYTGKKRRGEAPRGLLVFAPGFSSPHRQYLFYIQALCEAGFTVFSYDNTAVGESGGTGLGGLEQAVYDLRAGLELTAADPALSTLPLYLSGHSMGAYAAAAILCEKHLPVHAPVKGIIALSGINRPIEMELLHMGALKPFIYLPLRWTALVNWGRVAGYSAAKGLQRAAWGTRALFVYSGGDPVIPLSLYQRLERSLERCRQVQFLRLEGRGHIPYVPAGQWPLIEARQKAGPRPGEAQGDVDQACLELERGLDATFWTAVEGFLNT
jgi:pimeloyl-ACP methyl ester carboxylesterase